MTSIFDDAITVSWMTGSYNDTWAVIKQKKGRIYEEWSEQISLDCVLNPLKLTPSSRLHPVDIDKLKKLYQTFRE